MIFKIKFQLKHKKYILNNIYYKQLYKAENFTIRIIERFRRDFKTLIQIITCK